jgi:DNA (cytosine-5)-methyltransferase 3A
LLGCEPIFIDSGDFSAQERPRYYWTNIPVLLNYKISSAVLGDVLEKSVDTKYYYDNPLLNIDLTKQVCAIMDFKNHDMHKRIFNPNYKIHTLTCVSGGHQQKKVLLLEKVEGGYMVRARKLTPIEYERLQTLPDNYTAGVSDGARYTACGNGWTVDVIAHIFTHIKN